MFTKIAGGTSSGFHDAAVIEAIEPTLWLQLFDAFGAPPGFDRARVTIEHIVDRLSVSGLPEALQLALEWIYNLGSEEGVERLTGAAREGNVDLSALREAAPTEFVARVALLSANPAARKALDRAQTGALIAALPVSRVHEFRGRTAKPLECLDDGVADLRAQVAPWLDGLGLGDRIEATLRSESKIHRVVIVRGKRMQAPVTFTDSGRRPLPHRPVQCDLLVYDEEATLLAIHAPQALVEGYRRFVGEAFWGDGDHLVDCPCSLEPLKEGPALLERHANTSIRAIRLTHAKFRPHEGGSCDYTNDDAFELMRRMGVRFQEGDFVAARFQFTFYAGGGRSFTVEVRPDSIKAPPGSRQPLVLAALEQMGVCRVQNGDLPPLFWDLAVGPHPRTDWARHLGARVLEDLVAKGVLRGMRRTSVPHAALLMAGPILDVTAVDDDPPFFGQSVHGDVPGRALTHSDVEGLELESTRLAAAWASELECSATPRELAIAGLYDVGECTFGSKRVQVLLALRAPPHDLTQLAPTLPTGSIILAPRARVPSVWPVSSVELDSIVPDRWAARRSLVRALRVESEVDARYRAGPRDTLVVDAPRQCVWLHGLEMRLSDGSFNFVRLVASATQRGATASMRELIVALAGQNGAENTARMAKKKAEDSMKEQLTAAGAEPPAALFQAVQGAYRYIGSAFVGE